MAKEKQEKMETASGAGSKGGIRKPKPESKMEMASAAGSKGGVRKPKPEDEKNND